MKEIRKINKTAKRSYSVVLPMRYVKDLGWRERQKLQIRKSGKRIIIEDWKP